MTTLREREFYKSWVRSHEGILSPQAITVLAGRIKFNYSDKREETEAILRKRKLPVFKSILDFEELFGGIIWGGDTFGSFEPLRSEIDLRTLANLTDSDLEDEDGRLLLPVSFQRRSSRSYFWINDLGTIYLSNEADTFPVADNAVCFWEREALKANSIPEFELMVQWCALPTFTNADLKRFSEIIPDDDVYFTFKQDPQSVIDDCFAVSLGLPVFEVASDKWKTIWNDGSRLLYPRHPWSPSERLIRASNMNELFEMACVIETVSGAAVCYHGPLGEAPSQGEQVTAALDFCEDGSLVGKLLFIKGNDTHRIHLSRNNVPKKLVLIWEAREAELR